MFNKANQILLFIHTSKIKYYENHNSGKRNFQENPYRE